MKLFMVMIILMGLTAVSASVVAVSHPASLAGLLIMAALIVSALLAIYSLSWFFYLLALVFLGGVMVVLLFMVSVCANEKFYSSSISKLKQVGLVSLVGVFIFNPALNFSTSFNSFQLSSSLYESEGALCFMLFMLILILCLVSVVGVSSLESGPLVKRL